MQHDPEHILKMIDQLDENDVCYVKYKKENTIILRF